MVKLITDIVDGVDSSDGHADSWSTEHDDGKLGQVRENHSEDFSAFEAHPNQSAAEAAAQSAHLTIRVFPSSDSAFLPDKNKSSCYPPFDN